MKKTILTIVLSLILSATLHAGQLSYTTTEIDTLLGYTNASTAFGRSLWSLADEAAFKALVNLEIGTDVQAYDADLTTYAGITPSANAQSILSASTYAAMRALLDLESGTDFNAYDADLTTYAGITPSANAQGLLGAATYAAMRALLDLEAGTDFYSISAADSAFADKTHASQHNYGGADKIDLGTKGIPEATLSVNDSTPDASNSGTEIHHLFVTNNTELTTGSFVTGTTYEITTVGDTDFTLIGAASNTVGVHFTATGAGGGTTGQAIVVITNFDDGSGDPFSEFNGSANTQGRDWFVLRCKGNTVIDFNTGTYIDGNAGVNFTCADSNPLELVFRLDKTSDTIGIWKCQNLNTGFTNPTTLAVSKAQFDYDIANPKDYSVPASETDVTIGSELLSSIINLVGDIDSDSDEIDLQDAGSGYDGTLLEFTSKTDVAIDDVITVDVSEAGCDGCPLSSSFPMYDTNASLILRWDNTAGKWRFKSFYHPPFDYSSASTITGWNGETAEIIVWVQNNIVSCSGYISGTSDTTTITFTMPYTSKNTSQSVAFFGTGSGIDNGSSTGEPLKVWINEDSATVNMQPSFSTAAWTGSGTKTVKFSLTYPID